MKLPSRRFYVTLQRHWEWTGVHSGLQPSHFTSWSHEGFQPPLSQTCGCVEGLGTRRLLGRRRRGKGQRYMDVK